MIGPWLNYGPTVGPISVNHRTLLSLISPASPPSSSATGERKIKERRGYREAQGRWLGGGDPDRGRGRRLWWISGKPIWPKPYWRHYSKFSSAQWFCRLALLLPLLRGFLETIISAALLISGGGIISLNWETLLSSWLIIYLFIFCKFLCS